MYVIYMKCKLNSKYMQKTYYYHYYNILLYYNSSLCQRDKINIFLCEFKIEDVFITETKRNNVECVR